ncbi:sulfite exporter TauE/SafE family protein [Paraburkholderia jirisanensis]
MSVSMVLWLLLASLAASALGGMLGMASGIFIVPLLTLFGHFDLRTAIGASIVSVIACSCGGAASYFRARLTNVRLAIVLEVATTAGALSGVLLSGWIPERVLFAIFAVVLAVSAYQMGIKRRDLSNPAGAPDDMRSQDGWFKSRLHSTYPDTQAGVEVSYRIHRLRLGMMLMYGAGLISALLGIGSGVLKIPAMDSALRLPIKVSSATSNFMIGVTAAASAGVYLARGEIVTAIAGPVALGSVVGAVLGAKLLMKVPGERIRVLFVIVLLLLAIQMGCSALGVSLTGGA